MFENMILIVFRYYFNNYSELRAAVPSTLIHIAYCIVIVHVTLFVGFPPFLLCYAETCKNFYLSVRPSVARWYYVKITQARITKSATTDSPSTLFLDIKGSARNSTGFIPSEYDNESKIFGQ